MEEFDGNMDTSFGSASATGHEHRVNHEKRARNESPVPIKKPCNFMTQDVIEATIQCVIAQADECQTRKLDTGTSERLILEEFGRCLVEIIEFSMKNTDN